MGGLWFNNFKDILRRGTHRLDFPQWETCVGYFSE